MLTDPQECARLLTQISDDASSHAAVLRWKQQYRGAEEDLFEQVILRAASIATRPQIEALAVHSSVKKLLHQEFDFYAGAKPAQIPAAGTYQFGAAAKTITLRRFPAGPMDWEMGGFPRSWLALVPKAELPRVLWFFAARLGGFAP